MWDLYSPNYVSNSQGTDTSNWFEVWTGYFTVLFLTVSLRLDPFTATRDVFFYKNMVRGYLYIIFEQSVSEKFLLLNLTEQKDTHLKIILS